jgi:hypothetical protein
MSAWPGLGILLVVSCSPHVYIANVNAVVMAHYSISALFNVLITGMIVTKLLLHRRRMRRHLVCESGGVVGDVYISAIGVLAESAGLYSGSLIIYVVLYARQSPEVIWFSAVIMSASVSELLHVSITREAEDVHAVSEPSVDHPSHCDGLDLHQKWRVSSVICSIHNDTTDGAALRSGNQYLP